MIKWWAIFLLPSNSNLKNFWVIQKVIFMGASKWCAMSKIKIRLMFRCIRVSINMNKGNLTIFKTISSSNILPFSIIITPFQWHNFWCFAPYSLKFAFSILKSIVPSCFHLKMAVNLKLNVAKHWKSC